jgi:YVTN family beta-propeller protein
MASAVVVTAAMLVAASAQAGASGSEQTGPATGQPLTLSGKFGSVTVNTATGSVTNLFLRNPGGSLPAHSLTGGNPIGSSVTDAATGREFDSTLGTPASVRVGRDQSRAVRSIDLDGIPLTASHLLGTVSVGQSPNSVAFSPDGQTAYVTNFGSGTVSPVPATPVEYNASPVADWIWNTSGSASSAASGGIYLRKTFTTPPGVTQATLRINADDAETTYVNGVQVASSVHPDWPISEYANITSDLSPAGQENVIAVAAVNEGVSPAGVIAAVQIDGSSPERIVTDTTWKAWPSSAANPPVSASPPASNWNTTAYDDSPWETALSAGAYGISPWGTISDTGRAISVGGNPSGIVVAPDGDLVVAIYNQGKLLEVNPASGSIAWTASVGLSPEWPAITPDGTTVLVPNAGSDTVTAVDIATGAVEATIPVGSIPTDIAIPPGGSSAYVTDSGSGSVTPIDLETFQPLAAIPVGSGPIAAAATPDGQSIVISLSTAGAVVLLNVATGQVSAPIQVGGSPYGIAVSPDGTTAYVNDSPGAVIPVDLTTDTALAAYPAGSFPNGNAISPDGQYLLSADYSGSTVSRYDLGKLPPAPVTEDWDFRTTQDGQALQWTIKQHWNADFSGSADADPSIPFASGIVSTVWYNPAGIYSPSPDTPPYTNSQSDDHSETLNSTTQGPASQGDFASGSWAVYKLWSRYHLASDLKLGITGGYLTRSASQYGYVSDAGASFEPGQSFTASAGTTRMLTLTISPSGKSTTGYQLDASIPDTATLSSLQDFYESLLNGGTVAGQTSYLFGNEVAGYITGYEALPDGTALNVGVPSGHASSDSYSLDAAFRGYLVAMLQSVHSNGELYFGLSAGGHYQDTALWALLGLYQYAIHTGDLTLLRTYESTIASVLSFWTDKIQSNGLVMSSASDGNYYDAVNFGSTYYSTYVNDFVYEALVNMADLEHALSEQDGAAGNATLAQQESATAQGYSATAAGIKTALNTVMWSPNSPNGPMYTDWIDNDNGQSVYSFMDAAQYPAIVFGIASPTQAKEILATADTRLAQLPSLDGYTGTGTPNVLWPLPSYANSHNYAFGYYMNGGEFLWSTYYEIMARAMTGDTAGAWARLAAFAQDFRQTSFYGTNWVEPTGAVIQIGVGNEPYLQDMLLTAASLTQGILGIRGTWDKLSVTPALPAGWTHAQASVMYRGNPYCVTISNGKAATAHGKCGKQPYASH